ncbi:hypothetical protein QSH57_000317 [Fusarium oxysporum f. sp. vasinfectum]|nr:hypothetical protein QSH57_000317 [Fusarium oxysporum f. sp. vasinfectum]
MAPVGPIVHQNVANKVKRPVPPGIQTNGAITSSKSSPSPSMSAKKPPPSAKQPPHSASDRAITASTVRPVNRARRETASQLQGRHSRNSAGLRSASLAADHSSHDAEPRPYIVTDSYILNKFAGRPPSLVCHLHTTHFRFDNQDGVFPYKSPMKIFLDHVRSRTIPHDLLSYFTEAGVPFYDGCLIVQVHDHKSLAQAKNVAKPTKGKGSVMPSSIHNYNQCLTPSPNVPFPKEGLSNGDGSSKNNDVAEKENAPVMPAPEEQKDKATKPRVFTMVLHPTPESLQMDLLIKASTPRGLGDGLGQPPSTPMSLIPPTPTAGSMPPPAKRQKREKTELDGSNIYAAEGQILLATNAPLVLEPTKNVEETIILMEAMSHPKHAEAPPQPKTRKRTVAEMAADEAAAAETERFMLVADERLAPNANGAQNGGAADGDASGGASAFEPRFERFKVLADISREHAEKKEQEKLKQLENDRKLQQAKQQQQQDAHGHPQNNVVTNGVNNAAVGTPQMANNMPPQAQPRFQAQITQPPASSPVAGQGTPQHMSSPMVGSVPMQQTNSGMANSPPRPSSVVQNPAAMSVPMAHNMSSRGSQQSHPSGTPRMPHSTPNMAQGTPINRPAMVATPRMSQASPPPAMMAQNSQPGQGMMMNGQSMNQMNPQYAAQLAQQRAVQQQQQMAMQNGLNSGNMTPAFAAETLDCGKIRADGHTFDLSKLGGPHSVVTTRFKPSPPEHYNTTYTLDICKPLKKKGGKKDEECPNGTRVCGITHLLKSGEKETDEITNVIAIAGNLENVGGSRFDATPTRLKTSDSTSDKDKEGVRLVLTGGRDPLKGDIKKTDQKAIIEFLCDPKKEGTEGEWVTSDQYEKRADDDKKEGDGDDKDDGESMIEHQLKHDNASLIWNSFDVEEKARVLRLTWYTKYACEKSEDNGGSGDDDSSSSHWGFFTWFIIIAFLGIAGYLIFSSWINFTRYGARGWDLLPHSDTIRDIPYLLKDWIRRVLNTVQGTGSRGGYSAV